MPLLGHLPRLLADPCALAVELMRLGDEVVPLRLGPTTVYFVHHPDHLQHIMLDNHQNYSKGPLFARADILVGNGLVVSHGEAWRRQRRLMAPPFARKRLRELVPVIARVVEARLAPWRQGGVFEMWREMTGITMSALLESIFATSMDEGMVRRFVNAFDTIVDHVGIRALAFFLPERFPLPGRAAALAAREELHRIIEDIVAERRRSGSEGNDLLGLLLAARDEGGEGMSDEQLRDEVKTAVFAGYDSTATGLAFTLYLLAAHPESARRAREQIMEVMPEGLPDAEQVEQLDYLRRVFCDALRLYPPLAFHPRMALADDQIGGQRIPAGATLLYSNYAPGRNPAFWQYPDSFYPDHFLPEAVAQRHRFAYQPFAVGPRSCIGMGMAVLEAQIVLAMILRDYELVRPVNTPVMQGRMGTSRAKGGIWIELRPR
ncbi:MAG: cytochrome P450 [Enhygromyxa sp.]